MSVRTTRWIEPKPSTSVAERIPFFLVPVARKPITAAPAQIISNAFLVDAQSLQANMVNNKEALRAKLAKRPARGYLVQQGILPAPEGDAAWASCSLLTQRDALKRKIEQRPSKQKLVTQHILLSASTADPLIQKKAEVLKRCKLKDSLNRKLQRRPGPLELVTKKILQADAELEQAIQEGRVLFTKTTDLESEDQNDTLQQFEDMEVIATPTCSHQPKVANVCSARSRFRKKAHHQTRTPYDQSLSSPTQARSKIKLQDNKEITVDAYKVTALKADGSLLQPCSPNEVAEQFDDLDDAHSSYDLLLRQQHLFLQWQREVESTKAGSSLQQDDTLRQHAVESSCIIATAQNSSALPEVSYQLSEYQEPCSYNSIVSPTSVPETVHSSGATPRPETEKPKSKLSDYRVQDLKNECKKRQLPVSGPKPQLLERLKPYEDDILNDATAVTSQEAGYDTVTVPSPASDTSACSNRLPPISNVISDYIQQNVSQQQSMTVAQQQPVLVQIPATPQQQVLHLVDSNGAIIGNTTVPTNMQCYCIASDYAAGDGTLNGSRIITTDQLRTEGSHSATVQYINSQPQPIASTAEPTFSFAQLGSGGQFTLVQASSTTDFQQPQAPPQITHTSTQCLQPATQVVHVCGQLQPATAQSSQQTKQISQLQQVATTTIPIVQTTTAQIARPILAKTISQPPQTVTIAQPQPQQQILTQQQVTTTLAYNQKQQLPYVQYVVSANGTQHIVQQDVTPVAQRALCPPMQATLSSAECSPIVADSASECSGVPSPQEAYNKATSQQDPHQITIDPNDTNALLSATTLSIHEEMLRFQQRKIEELQRELYRSQQQLKHQQQVILAAKKAQQRKRQEAYLQEGGDDQKSQAEVWLRQLDINKLNKFHIQLFVQHKKQQQQMQAQIAEQEVLSTTEQKLQEELHVEQAVQDIVRLIKQDARTALLIVQLLRQYQLERSQAIATATQAAEEQNTEQQVIVVEGQQTTVVTGTQEETTHTVVCSEQPSTCSPTTQQYSNNQHQSHAAPSSVQTPATNAPSLTKQKAKKKSSSNRLSQQKSESEGKEKTSSTVDMEEIFKKVLEDASRALMSDPEKGNETTTCVDYSVNDGSAYSTESLQQQQTQYVMKNSSPDALAQQQQCEAFTPCESYMKSYLGKEPTPNEYSVGQVVENVEQNEDCYRERIEVVEEGAVMQSSAPYQYSKNQEFDDLMDVLRDDQAGIGEFRPNEGDFEMGNYSSEELATLFSEEWFDHDSTMQATPAYTQECDQSFDQHETSGEPASGNTEQVNMTRKEFMPQVKMVHSSDQGVCMDWLDVMIPPADHNDIRISSERMLVADSFG